MSCPPILYFHGMPGGETEVSAFGPTAFDRGITAVRRTEILWRTDDFDTYLDQLADWVSQTYPDQRVHLVGFSLGAMTVLRLLNRLGDQVMQVDLISPAAPLEMGNFLPDMAGSPVFRAAQKSVWLLWVMAYVQSLLHRVSPDFMYKMIFASAQSADQTLCQTPRFKDQIGRLIGRCLHGQRDEYRRDIMAYVTPWATEIPVAQMPVKLWHGTLDNWSPPAMSVALKSALGPQAQIKVCDGASHYSTLKIALDAISNVPATV